MAGCLALAWSGLLRAGEVFQAKRKDLQLPSDLGGTTPFILLAINEPKSRFTTARHQAAKVDIPDMVSVIELALQTLQPSEFLSDLAKSLQGREQRFEIAVYTSRRYEASRPGLAPLRRSNLFVAGDRIWRSRATPRQMGLVQGHVYLHSRSGFCFFLGSFVE